MGFCLFRHGLNKNSFFAVNSASVDDVVEMRIKGQDLILSEILLAQQPHKSSRLLVAARSDQVNKIIKAASVLGVKPAMARMVPNLKGAQPVPLQINNPDRIVLVQEIDPDDYTETMCVPIASSAHFEDESVRILAMRPGTFAYMVNARHDVPMLI